MLWFNVLHASGGETKTLNPNFEIPLPDGGTLLVAEDSWDVGEYFLLHAHGRVRAYSISDGKFLGETPPTFDNPPRWIGTARDRFTLATRFEITEYRFGETLESWTVVESQRKSDPDPENNNPIRRTFANDRHLFALFADGKIVCSELDSKKESWHRTLSPKPAGKFANARETLAYLVRTEQGESVHVMRATDGKEQSIFAVQKGDSVQDLFPGDSTTVIQIADGFVGFNSQSGEQRWRMGGHSRLNAGHVAADADGIYVSVDGHQAVRFSRETGEREWRYSGVGVNAPAHITMSADALKVVLRGEDFVQVLNAKDGRPLGRIDGLNQERIRIYAIRGNELFALVKPPKKDSLWRLECIRLSGNTTGKHFYFPRFPRFKEAVILGDSIVVVENDYIHGFVLPDR